MATSGTVGATVINTAKVIEHAIRRCKLSPASITFETLDIAKQSLHLLLTALANKGLNLWCVETDYVGLEAGRATYSLPVGTIDLLSLVHSRPSEIAGTGTQAGINYTKDVTTVQNALRIGVKFNSIAASETVSISSSSDDVTYTVAQTKTRTDWVAGKWYWFGLDPIVNARYFRVSTVANINVNELFVVGSLTDIEIIRYNRDDYMNLPNKQIQAALSTNYYYERKLTPQVTLWPVPNDSHNHMTTVCHRQVQDVGELTQTLEIPSRWYEAVIWKLAETLCFELPNVDPAWIPTVMAKSVEAMNEVESEETDGANIRFGVRIGAYSK
jgi:hypothetical protein